MIEMKHLDIRFDNQIIFKNANFKTCPGKITGIIGKSGCGKTTFLKALIYQYSNQTLSIDKQTITEKNKEDYLLNCVSYIDQFGTFFENMKIREHFKFISQLKSQGFDQDKMLEVLHLVGLDNIDLSYFPSSLSIGQRKRFLIALAMFKDASIIIIDEPTASLDQENKEIILNLLQNLKKDNKYIIITTHDDFLIEHLDIVYEIENKQLYCHQEIKEVQQDLKIENIKHKRIKKYFFYKNQRQWFQFILVMLLGFIMTVSISTNISDSILQENQLANGIERANKAEVYTGKVNDAFLGNDGYYIANQEDNLDISDDELAQMKAIKHVKGVYPFDVFDTINQMQNVTTTSVYCEEDKVNFDYFKSGSPLVAPYYSFQNIKSNGKKFKGNAISQSLANKLGIDKDEKNFKISVEVYIPVQQYSYQGEMNESGLKAEMSQVLTKKVKLDLEVDHIISVDDYYNEFLSARYTILMPEKSFYSLLNQYNNQTPDSLLDAKELNATITPYHSKNYVVEVDRISNLKTVEKEITKISKNLVTYDQYNSVIDTTDVYKEERKGRYIYMVMVVLVAIVLYAMVQINALDDRKNEVKLLKLYGLNDKDIHSLVNENGFVQLLLSLVLGIPGFFIARKMGFFAVNDQSLIISLLLFFSIQIAVSIIIYILYLFYSKYFVRKVKL
ncbi:ATP-binding cassette domain-containing protein [Faecalibacillus intestinalis]|uniref:ATP-binding cassette domain-containing protein n=1 Tax=Faecalibacillus intestinalis TaxID=1982626 RepID=UPI003AB1F0E4